MGVPHALLLPFPAQGHVIPFMELAHLLVDHGFRITFVNTEFNHDRIVATLSKDEGHLDRIHLVSVPDGLAPEEERNALGRLSDGLQQTVPLLLEELITKSNETRDCRITCMIADLNMGWALEIAKKMALRSALLWPASSVVLATLLSIPKLIDNGIIDADGFATGEETFQLSQDMPLMESIHLPWAIGDHETQKIVFHYMKNNNRATEIADYVFCNSFQDIELPTFNHVPKLLPLGPLPTGQRLGKAVGHFWPEDATCMDWLDEQPANSVIYVAFGSFTIFGHQQFQELALGLEMSGLSFLWVVRPDLTDGTTDTYPDGYKDRVARRARMVGWCPQQKVLAHPSVACFISHCGWNSTLEGVRNGVPFLCWPYFADQFINQTYICDIWKVGLKMVPDETRIIRGEHVSSQLKELLGDDEIRARAQMLKELANRSVHKGGSSYKNLNSFIESMKTTEQQRYA
ncbi:UDP-glycosyltransferase 83A1-like [Typha angustifolia]|uniref:UDP-glycosyltransferase 83A1-like n=1 Tax=Typha angustifolia TaxID=59011 RepID=UPI003C2E2087